MYYIHQFHSYLSEHICSDRWPTIRHVTNHVKEYNGIYI